MPPFISETVHRTAYSPAAAHDLETVGEFVLLKVLSPKSQEKLIGSPSGSFAAAVKFTVTPVATLVALAATFTVGAWLLAKLPTFTTTSMASGVVPALAIGVIW